MAPDFIKNTGYVIFSTLIHSATIIGIAMSPQILQMGTEIGDGNDIAMTEGEAPVENAQIEIVEVSFTEPTTQPAVKAPKPEQAKTEAAKKAEQKSDDFVVVKAKPKAKPKPKVEAKKKQIENKDNKVAAKKVEAKKPKALEEPKPIEEKPVEDMKVETIAKSEVLKDLAMEEKEEVANTDDTIEQVQQEENKQLMPDKNPETAAEDTRMLEAVAAADAAAGLEEETPSLEEFAKQSNEAAQKTVEPLEESAEEPAQEVAAATGAATQALPQKGAAQGPATSTGSKVAKQSFTQLRQVPGNKAPSYPERARLNRKQGAGQLKYFVTKEGQVTDLTLTKSTGHPELDRAAVQSFQKFRFVPGQAGYTVHNFEFALKGKELPARGRLRTTLSP